MIVADERGGPLSGALVIDLSRAMAGPYAAMMLGDAGATVVMSGFGAGLSWGTAVWKWQG